MKSGRVKTPAYQWYPRDFAADEPVLLMSLEEEGAYRRLLDHQWLHGSIPADVKQLAYLCKGVSMAKMKAIWGAVGECFAPLESDPARLQNARLERVRQAQDSYRDAKVASGKKGGRNRWLKERGATEMNSTEDGKRDSGAMDSSVANDSTASATASATALPTTTKRVRVFAAVPERYHESLDAVLTTSRDMDGVLSILWAMVNPEDGTSAPGGKPVSGEMIGQALLELRASGDPRFNARFFRGILANLGSNGVASRKRGPAESPGEKVLRMVEEQDRRAAGG